LPRIAFVCTTFALTLFSGFAGATTITSTFDTDLDGWTTNPQGTLAFVAAGGTPNGYLEEIDNSSGGNMHVIAPAKFLGDLTGFSNLSVDIRAYATPATIRAAFGTLTFVNGALSISLDLGDPSTVWTNYATSLNAAAFGVSAVTYGAVMSNVTGVTLILETDKDSDTEAVGMDNFTISDLSGAGVPEPASFGLLGSALTLGAYIRKKRAA
jgi:hypothetical protein